MRLQLKMAIHRSGRSQRATAALAGMSENRLSQIVRAWVEPTTDERIRLGEILGVGAEVFQRDDQMACATERRG